MSVIFYEDKGIKHIKPPWFCAAGFIIGASILGGAVNGGMGCAIGFGISLMIVSVAVAAVLSEIDFS